MLNQFLPVDRMGMELGFRFGMGWIGSGPADRAPGGRL